MAIIPTISWSDEASHAWCIDGEPIGGTVMISTLGNQKNPGCKKLFMKGYDAMLERLEPDVILCYGAVPKECRGSIVRIATFAMRKWDGVDD